MSIQIAMIFVAVISIIIVACLLANNLLLEKYYIYNKEKALVDAYIMLNNADNNNAFDTDEFDIELQRICDKFSLDVLVIDSESSMLKYKAIAPEALKLSLWDHLFGGSVNQENASWGETEKKIITQNEQYEICVVLNSHTAEKNMEIWGVLDSDNLFIISVPLESVKDSVNIANRLLAYIGIFAVLVGSVVITILSRRISKPIRELSVISQKITQLDFDEKYHGTESNEIGVLGDNINRLSESLEQTISDLKSANNELKSDNERKDRVDEMRKEFISSISHELKTPIALIQGYAEALEEGISDDPATTLYYIDVIKDESSKMNKMVKQLLDLNRIEFGNEKVEMERFDIIAMIRSYIAYSEVITRQSGITISYPGEEVINVWGDEYRVEQVFSNYMTNAINHCEGEKRIDIKVKRNEGRIRVSVFNTGAPIPEESIDRIWDKFYKVDKARTREYGGSGVGLSIVKAIMESMNQQYGVVNYDDGVEFWFELDIE